MKDQLLTGTNIVRYNSKDRKVLEKLMEGLQDYLVSTDYFKILYRPEQYGKKYVKYLLRAIKDNQGVIFLAKDKNQVVGCIAGIIYSSSPSETLGNKSKLKNARILELYISPEFRGKKLGPLLIQTMENYFLDKKCDRIKVEVYAPNKQAHIFYQKQGYENESIDLVKELEI